jgi:hypothetical protein
LISATVSGVTSTYAFKDDVKRANSTTTGVTERALYDMNANLPLLLEDGERKYV